MAAPARQLPERERRSSMVLRSTRSDGQAAKDERNDRFAQSRLRRQIVFICMIVAGVMISQIAQRELIVRSSYQLVSVKNQVNNLQKENEFLKIELAGLSSPDRIQQIATKELGMVVPERVHYVQTSSTEKATKDLNIQASVNYARVFNGGDHDVSAMFLYNLQTFIIREGSIRSWSSFCFKEFLFDITQCLQTNLVFSFHCLLNV